jgi:hypothetical protein|tara:strand:+ start:35 stop:451 length:417 start_codon:yes stop_codon:yes gene_type:complete
MAFFRGEEGSVKFDDGGSSAAAITSTRAWSMTIDKAVLEATALGDTYAANVGGIISGSGSVELLYTASSSDETNVFIEAVNTATDAGGALFELYTDTSGSKKISFDGVITSADYSATVGEVEVITCNFVTNGTITLDI